MQLSPNLTFNGQCEAAFRLYEECLGGKTIFKMTYEEMPAALGAPPDWRNKIGHATFALGETRFYGTDALPGSYQKPQGFVLQLDLSDPAQAERIFNALSKNGTVQMPLQETFWAHRFAVLTDQFGIPWTINCEKPAGAARC